MHIKGCTGGLALERGPWIPAPPPLPSLAPARRSGVGREGAGQEGISPGSPSRGGPFKCVLPRAQPCPLPGPRPGLCLPWGSGLARLAFHSWAAFACFPLWGQAPALPGSPGADGPQWESARLVLRGLAPFFPPFVLLPTAARAQPTKAACLAASGGAGVTADGGAPGDGGTPCEPESRGHPGSREGRKSWATGYTPGFTGSRGDASGSLLGDRPRFCLIPVTWQVDGQARLAPRAHSAQQSSLPS